MCVSLPQDFPNAEIVWAQEEPKNQGAYTYVKSRIATALSKSAHHAGQVPKYVLCFVSSLSSLAKVCWARVVCLHRHRQQEQPQVRAGCADKCGAGPVVQVIDPSCGCE
jgi:hypothetical protein